METAMTMVGCVYSTYIAARIGATVWDVCNRWLRSRKGDPNAWKVDGEE